MAMADRLEAGQAALAALLTAENGKLLTDSAMEVANAASMCRYNAGLARNLFGRVTEIERGLMAMLPREAIGVAGIIVPWNAPIGLLFRSLAPALAAGCTVVIKPAPQTALVTARALAAVLECGALPPGVVNLVLETGSDAARALVASPAVDVISYTGSTAIGKRIVADGARTLKRLNLELGGITPAILLRDADVERALPALVKAGMIFAGQQCVAVSRVLVQRSRVDEVVERLADRLAKLVVGSGAEQGTEMGPMIDALNRDRVDALVSGAAHEHEVILKGCIPDGTPAGSAFLRPSLIRLRGRDSELTREEIFGPVLTIDTFDDEGEAVAIANGTRLGLAASVWTGDLRRAQRMALELRYGTVWINQHGRFHHEVEIGGYKESGLGRLNGATGIDDFLQTKHIGWSVN
jgi:acyl-CoA reductase-like NAD-dependent aldehyde dehydrogenase